MSWYDRDYSREEPGHFGGGGGALNFAFPPLTPIVKYFLMANVGLLILTALTGGNRSWIYDAFALRDFTGVRLLELWRLVTYQFLHGDPWHLFVNMIGLYFFGTQLERLWGSRQFVIFYLVCGVAGGIAFLILGPLIAGEDMLVGASGAILGLLAACAILFPRMIVLFLFFPVPIRWLAIGLGVLYVLNIIWSGSLSDVCHLGGMLTGVVFIAFQPFWRQFRTEARRGQWQQRVQQEQTEQEEVDRILDKVHREGIGSLSRHEKKVLRQATEHQRNRDERIRRDLRR
ncbi:MAG: rhomboid family intramembrane serine protease [Phycisphaerae bacterium]|nr:rhomboid family intramembrane serine protease [Phycisphaerae bacterium]